MTALPLFAETVTFGQRPPVGEYTHIEKPTQPPFLPELAARALASLGPEWQWHTVESIYADESDPFHSPRIGTRVRLNIPTVGRTGKKWPPLKTDRVLIVTEAQEQAAAAQWEQEHGACVRCGGDGLVLAGSCSNKGHRFRTCDRCDGTGKPAVHP